MITFGFKTWPILLLSIADNSQVLLYFRQRLIDGIIIS